MHIAHSLEEIPSFPHPIALTIGSFDGVHLGHRFLIEQLRSSLGSKGSCALLTFSNHPSDILPFLPKAKQLCSVEQKVTLLKEVGIDLLILLSFTRELANTPYDQFLTNLYAKLPFAHLILGKGARFGKGGLGTEARIQEIAPHFGFHPHYLEKMDVDGEKVSSGKIRHYLEKGDLKSVNRLLGRPYTLIGEYRKGTLLPGDFCLPPPGNYPLLVKAQGETFAAEAHVDAQIAITCQKKLSECKIEALFIS